ncbi:hypothetical protein YC2023_004672 [Brassica napus]
MDEYQNEKKKRQRRKEDCRRRKESVEEDWSSPSSRILSSSPSILADVVLVTVSQIHFFQSPSSPCRSSHGNGTAVAKEEDNNDLPALVIWKKHTVTTNPMREGAAGYRTAICETGGGEASSLTDHHRKRR